MIILLRWLANKAWWLLLSFLVVTAALALLNELPAQVREWRSQAVNAENVVTELRAGSVAYERWAQSQVAEADDQIAFLRRAGEAQLVAAEADTRRREAEARTRLLSTGAYVAAIATGSSGRIIAHYRALYVELPLLARAARFIAARRSDLRAEAEWRGDIASHSAKVADYNRDLARLREISRRAAAQRRKRLCRRIELPGICRLAARARELAGDLRTRRGMLNREATLLRQRQQGINALRRSGEQVRSGSEYFADATRRYASETRNVAATAEDYGWNRGKDALARYGWQAFLIVLGAFLLPILHKLFVFNLIAPLAGKARPVRLIERGQPSTSGSSSISVEVPIDRDTELLLRSGLQSGSATLRGSDKYVLDWRMPLSCVAAGLVNLQRLRSSRPDHVSVTGSDDDHRVACIIVPSGGAVALHPRALLGISKPRHRRLKITRPWRLRSWISWITVQFRYVVFHGPCTLIVQGRHGVAFETASTGRMVNKRLTLGFDAALEHGAARSTSFLPFLRGQASLFNDRFTGSGLYFYEQRPTGPGKGSLWGRGLRGLGDAALSAFGI